MRGDEYSVWGASGAKTHALSDSFNGLVYRARRLDDEEENTWYTRRGSGHRGVFVGTRNDTRVEHENDEAWMEN